MTARIVNRLMPCDGGTLFDTAEEAESALFIRLMNYAQQGYTVTRSDFEVDGQRWFSVLDEARRPFGLYGLLLDD